MKIKDRADRSRHLVENRRRLGSWERGSQKQQSRIEIGSGSESHHDVENTASVDGSTGGCPHFPKPARSNPPRTQAGPSGLRPTASSARRSPTLHLWRRSALHFRAAAAAHGRPRLWRWNGRFDISDRRLFLKNNPTKLLKTQGVCPESDKTIPISDTFMRRGNIGLPLEVKAPRTIVPRLPCHKAHTAGLAWGGGMGDSTFQIADFFEKQSHQVVERQDFLWD